MELAGGCGAASSIDSRTEEGGLRMDQLQSSLRDLGAEGLSGKCPQGARFHNFSNWF